VGDRVVRVPRVGGDEFVAVFAAGVIAHVKRQRTTLHGEAGFDPFVAESAHGGAFFGRAVRVVGVDFYHPAEIPCLVAPVLACTVCRRGDVEARELVLFFGGYGVGNSMPEHAFALVGNAVADVFGIGLAADEIALEVPFAGQIGIPGRIAATTVVERAAGPIALRAVRRGQQL